MQVVYQFKITLDEINPPIWRRVLVPSGFTLLQFHHVIQFAFAWEDVHLYGFKYQDKYFDDENPKSLFVKLETLELIQNEAVFYTYDYSSYWHHIIVVEDILESDVLEPYPICIEGERAAPPEDIEGICGYDTMMIVLSDKSHPEYESTLQLLGEHFDPEIFDLESINQDLKQLRTLEDSFKIVRQQEEKMM